MNPVLEHQLQISRRQLLGPAGTGVATAALAGLLGADAVGATVPSSGSATTANPIGGLPDLPHLSPKVKNVIYLFQNGAPTHVDLFDYKPRLSELHGQPVPPGFVDDLCRVWH